MRSVPEYDFFVNVNSDKFQESKSLQNEYENGEPDIKDKIFKSCIVHLFEMVKDKYYNYVIQKIFDCNFREHGTILFNKLKDILYELQQDKYGSRVFQKMIEANRTPASNQFNVLFGYIRNNLDELLYHENGNFIIQKCLEVYTAIHLNWILQQIEERVQILL